MWQTWFLRRRRVYTTDPYSQNNASGGPGEGGGSADLRMRQRMMRYTNLHHFTLRYINSELVVDTSMNSEPVVANKWKLQSETNLFSVAVTEAVVVKRAKCDGIHGEQLSV